MLYDRELSCYGESNTYAMLRIYRRGDREPESGEHLPDWRRSVSWRAGFGAMVVIGRSE
ncbi:hypothetical protein D3C86_1727520 [compost metagenome]